MNRKTKQADYTDITEELANLELADKLEEHIASEQTAVVAETADQRYVRRIKEAQAKIGDLRLRPMTLTLLALACANVAASDGRGMPDEDARTEIQERAALFTAFNLELVDVLNCLREHNDTDAVPGLVYSTCFAVQKAANFVTNLKYRAALDPNDGEGLPVHDYRELSEPPVGLGPDGEEVVEAGDAREHMDSTVCRHVEILTAFEELHVYLQLLSEAFGWDAENPMPYLFVQSTTKDGKPLGTFAPVHDAEHALDIVEVRSKEARAKRIQRRSAGLRAALEGAKNAVLKAGRIAA